MKNALVQLGLVLLGVSSVHAVKLLQSASFHARIFPAGAVEKVWAIQGKDSIPMQGSDGQYYLTTFPPGTWRVWVSARSPYHDVSIDTDLRPGTNKDLGDIQLTK
ncbi:MAG: hypothetical protein Q8927_07965 [Bacteroidota bacterium]|nr:hypothetical protein [Bacteroidota bacterium]MDP4216123.1 hypothetical protein [Bacteroidota bacterium]MDP4247535.1 hypothetical protein [Bacteroidota bacterium]MDP4252723.1 hypothetical protein [Bacteroidota bacterium]MDP4260463.1 hypothetical protein [Bacteroidota bacterium]